MWPNPQETSDLVTFTDKILNGKLDLLCNVYENAEYLFINSHGHLKTPIVT